KGRAGNLAELHLGVVEEIDVEAFEAEVRERKPEPMANEAPAQDVVALHDFAGLDDAGLDEGFEQVAASLGGRRAIVRKEADLAHDDDLVALEPAGREGLAEHAAEDVFAPLAAVVEGGVEDVDAAFEGARDGLFVEPVGRIVRSAEIGAEPDARADRSPRNLGERTFVNGSTR